MYAVIFHMLIPQEIIAMKRACRPVSRAQIEAIGDWNGAWSGVWWISGLSSQRVSRWRCGAFISGGAWCDHLFGSTCACTNVIIDRISES